MKFGFKIIGTALMAMAIAAPAFAGQRNDDHDRDDRHVPKHSVPEINGAGASLALALLGGMVLISRERRKSKY